jgi:nucleoside-diphosphate-sugar epimerase
MDSGLDWTIVRPTMIYGTPGDRNMIRLLKFLKASPVVPVLGTGDYLQQPIHVEDLARAIADCLEAPAAVRKAYNLSGAAPLSYNQVVDQACAALGVSRPKLFVPLGLSLWAARLAEKLPFRTPVKEEQILRLNENKDFDHAEAARDFGFAPRPFAEGIRQEVSLC